MSVKKIISAPVLLKVLAALIVLALPAYAIPTLIDFQGKLTDNNNNAQAGSFNMTFIIYTQSTGGAILWQENKLVTVTGGIFSTLLGSVNPINTSFGQNSFLEIVTSGETLSPRYQIGSVPYAFRANVSELALASSTTTPSFIIKSITGQTSNLTEWHDASGNVIAYMDIFGNINITNNNITARLFYGNGSMLTDVLKTGSISFADANATNLFITSNLTILKNLSVGTTVLFVDTTNGFINVTRTLYVTNKTGNSGMIVLGYTSDDGAESISFDPTLGSKGKFVFTAPLQIAANSPGITFYDASQPTNTSRQSSIKYNYSNVTNPISFTNGIEVNGSLSLLGSSPAFIRFGKTGSTSQDLSYDPNTQEFSFTGGTIAQDFSNMIKNGGFESFSGAGTFSGGSYGGFAPDGWRYQGTNATTTMYWYAPSSYTIGTDIYQGYNSLQLNPSGGTGKVVQVLYSNQLQPNKTYSIGVWVKAISGTTARLNVTGSALVSSFTMQQSSIAGWRQLKGQFSTKATLTTSDNITVELDAVSGTGAYFDSVQLNTGGVLGEYQDTPITQTGDQTIYGGLRLQRTGYGRGGTLTVDQAIRTKQIEFSYNADPGYGGIDPRYMSDPRYNWTGTYASSNVVMELWGDYALKMRGGSGSSNVNEFAFLFNNPAGPTLSTTTGKSMIVQGSSSGGMTVLNVTNGTTSGSGSFGVYLGQLAGDNAAGVSIGTGKDHPLAFFTNNVDRMRITSDGKVGIGKTNPNTALDVQGTVTATLFVGDGSQLSGVSTNANVSSAGSTGYVPFFGNATQLNNSVMFQNGSSVGIGTTAPDMKLHVYAASGDAMTNIQSVAANSTALLQLKNDVQTWQVRIDGDDLDKFKIRDSTVGVYRLTIDSSGNVGIGTTGPNTQVHVYGSGAKAKFQTVAPGAPDTLIIGSTVFPGAGMMTESNTDLALGTNNAERVRITTTGNVGIGTVSPGAKLDVNGTLAVGGGFGSGGATITSSGDVWINGTLYVTENITNVNITNLNVNGTIRPAFDALFDLGSSGNRFSNAYLSSEVYINSVGVSARQSADNTTLGSRIGTQETKQSADNTTMAALLGMKVNLTQLSSYETTSAHASDNTTVSARITTNTNDISTLTTKQSSDNTTLGNRIGTQETKQSADNTTAANTYAKLSGAAFTGDVTVGGGLAAGGITLQTSGNIWANGSLYILGNITNVNITNLNVNGTIRPAFDATFDLGTSGNRFANAYVSNDVTIGGVAIKARQSSDNTTLTALMGTKVNLTQMGIYGNVSSAGSTGYVPFFGNATQLNNSVIYQNGTNVGIGTTGPLQLLHLNSSSTAGTAIRLQNAGTNGRIWELYSNGADNLGGAGGFQIYDGSGGGNRLFISTTGNVGIGTTSPTAKFEVAGSANITSSGTSMKVTSGGDVIIRLG